MKNLTKFLFFLILFSSFLIGQTLTLDAPINGITGQPIIPITFQWHWNTSYTPASCTLKIATDAAFTDVIITDVVYTNNSVTYTYNEQSFYTYYSKTPKRSYLEQNKTYYWKLYGKLADNTDYTSPTYHFTTFAPGTTVSLHNPIQDQTGVSTTVNFSWGSDIASAKYKLQWIASPTPPTPAQWLSANEYVTTNKQYTLTMGGGTKYYWRVSVVNSTAPHNKYYAFSDVFSFTTLGGASVPIPNYPNGPITNPTILYSNDPWFSWGYDGSIEHVKFDIELWELTDLYGTPTVFGVYYNIEGLTYHLGTNLNPNNYYFWRIRAHYNDGIVSQTSGLSDPKYFKTQGPGMVYKPTLTYPIDNNLVYTLRPYLQWCIDVGVSGLSFNIKYWKSTESEPVAPTVTGLTSYSYQIPSANPLVAGTKYLWRVQSYLGSNLSDWSDVDTFNVVGGLLTQAVPNYPKGDVVVYSTKPTLSWTLNGDWLGITGYKITIYKGSSIFNTYTINDGFANNYTIPDALEPDVYYNWTIAVRTAAGTGTHSAPAYFYVYGPSNAGVPILLWPKDAIVYSNSQTLSWSISGSEANIQGYVLKYSYSDQFADGVTETISIPTNTKTYTINNLVPGAIYYWKVKSWYGGSVYSSYSAPEHFIVFPGTSPMQPLVGGPNNMGLNVQSPTLTWLVPIPSTAPLTYEVEYADNPEFNSATVINNIPNNSYTLNNLTQNKTYYWRVRSKVPSGTYSNYSNIGNFGLGIVPTDVKDETPIPTKFELSQNYPNPFNPSTTINYSLPEMSNVKLEIYNSLGQKVAVLVDKQMQAGKHSVTFNAENLSSGIYFYILKADKFNQIKKMVLVK